MEKVTTSMKVVRGAMVAVMMTMLVVSLLRAVTVPAMMATMMMMPVASLAKAAMMMMMWENPKRAAIMKYGKGGQ